MAPAMSHAKYLAIAVLTCLALLTSAVGVNWFVDPDNLFGNNWTGLYVDNDRSAKRRLVKAHSHDAILIGSSKVATIDPDDLRGHRFFNASMVGVVPEEFFFFLRDHTDGVRHVVLGLDFYMFNERESPFVESDTDVPRGAVDGLSYLFGINILKASVATLYKWLSGESPRMLGNGQRNPDFKIRADRIFDAPEYAKILKYLDESHYHDYRYSTRRLAVLQDIRKLMAERGIRLTVFINPLNEKVLQMLKGKPEWQLFIRFRRDVASIFPGVLDLSESQWSASENFYFSDPWHYRHNVGAAMVNSFAN